MIKDEPHSQTHYLEIDDSDDFNKANQGLAGVDDYIRNRMEVSKKGPTQQEVIIDIAYWLRQIEKLPSKDKEMLYPKAIKVFSALAMKMISAWGQAAKQDKEELKRDYARKTGRK